MAEEDVPLVVADNEQNKNLTIKLSPEPLTLPVNLSKCQNLYYMYDHGKNHGPYTVLQLALIYIRRSYKGNSIWICKATDSTDSKADDWVVIRFPDGDHKSIMDEQENTAERGILYGYSSDQKDAEKEQNDAENEFPKYPSIIKYFIEPIKNGTLQQPRPPTEPPKPPKPTCFGIQCCKCCDTCCCDSLLSVECAGGVVVWSLSIIIIFHLIVGALTVFAIFCGIVVMIPIIFCAYCLDELCFKETCGCNKNKLPLRMADAFILSSPVISFSGLMILPIIILISVVSGNNKDLSVVGPILIAYVVWGMCCFLVITSYICLPVMGIKVMWITNIISGFLGVDFGNLDIKRHMNLQAIMNERRPYETYDTCFNIMGDCQRWIVLVILPSLASAFIAVIAWFVADYFFTTQYRLDCGDEFNDTSICTTDGDVCCGISSSHVWDSHVIGFVSGIGGTIFSMYGVLKITGFLLLKFHPKLSMYAQSS
eukprot:454757_1